MAGATKFMKKLAILANVETTYGTDPTLTGAANAMVVYGAEWTPLDGDEIKFDNVQPYFGASGSLMASQFARLKFNVPYSGSGVAGTAPKWGPLARMSAMSQTLNAGVSVVYAPITSSLESGALYCNIDGTQQKCLGGRADCTITLDAKGRPMFTFEITALWAALTDTALPAASYTGWVKELPVNKANTVVNLFGVQCALKHFELKLGNQVEKRDMTDIDLVDVVDRKAGGSLTIQQSTVAFKDWVSLAKARTLGSWSVTHGGAAGNILTLAGTNTMELGKPSFSEDQGVQLITLPFTLIPSSAGNDEFALTCT